MPFLPLHDLNPRILLAVPWITWGTIAACTGVFFYEASLAPPAAERFIVGLSVIPATLLGGAELPPELALVPPEATLVTALFLHGSLMHLIGNMLFLWVFGDNVEDSMGHGRFILFYGLCGVIAGLAHAFSNPASVVPVLGASGAISGVLGAYLVLHPRARVLIPVLIFPMYLPAAVLLVVWFGFQALALWGDPASEGGVAWWAHVAGFLAGAILIVPFRYKSVPLFGQGAPLGVRMTPRERWQRGEARRREQRRDRENGPWG